MYSMPQEEIPRGGWEGGRQGAEGRSEVGGGGAGDKGGLTPLPSPELLLSLLCRWPEGGGGGEEFQFKRQFSNKLESVTGIKTHF